MYNNLPFTGAPFAYIALAIVFISAGLLARLWAKFVEKRAVKQNKN